MEEDRFATTNLPEVTVTAPRKYVAGYDSNGNPIYTENARESMGYTPYIGERTKYQEWVNRDKNAPKYSDVFVKAAQRLIGAPLATIAGAPVVEASMPVMEAMARPLTTTTRVSSKLFPSLSKALPYTEMADRGLMGYIGAKGTYDAGKDWYNGEMSWYQAIPQMGLSALIMADAAPLGKLAKSIYEGGVQPKMGLFNPTLTSRPRYSPIIQRSVGTNITTGTSKETAKAVEKGRKTLLDWVRSPFYKARLEDEPLYRVADDVVADAGKMIEDVPIDISKTKLKINPSGLVNGTTVTRPATQTQLPNGTIVADLNTGLNVSVASDLGKEADETALHELLHYMTANSKGEPISQAGERIIKKSWMEPTETHFDAINIIHKNRSKSWQDFIMDQNNSLLPQYDPVVKMVMKEPDKAISFLQKSGRTEADAKSAVQSLRARYSEWYDIQEQRAYLQQLFLAKIRPNLKNPNDAAEIEEYLSLHPEVLDDYPAYEYIQEVRPGSLKDYAKYFSAALGTIPFIPKLTKDDEK